MRYTVRRGAGLVLAAAFVAGCISSSNNPLSSSKEPLPPGVARVDRPAADIDGADIDGKSFKLSDYRGKVVLLDFSATW